jgi:hypothetical protein
MSDQPKKQELPPFDDECKATFAKSRLASSGKLFVRMSGPKLAMLECRERQLLAALSDNEAKAARIAELSGTRRPTRGESVCKNCGDHSTGPQSGLSACVKDGETNACPPDDFVLPSPDIYHFCDGPLPPANITAEDTEVAEKYYRVVDPEHIALHAWRISRERELVELAAKLRAVSEALEEKLERLTRSLGLITFYWADPVDALLAKLRAIVEGKC